MRGQRHAPAVLYPPEKDPVSVVQEVGWASGPVWIGAENLVPSGIRSPDSPARRQSQLSDLKCINVMIHRDRHVSGMATFTTIIGGILVLFIYITRLASNEIFSP